MLDQASEAIRTSCGRQACVYPACRSSHPKCQHHIALVGRVLGAVGVNARHGDDVLGKAPSVQEIQRVVAAYFNMNLIDMTSACRARSVARPRQVAMYLARELTGLSFIVVGRLFGGKDHSTVIHGVRLIEDYVAHQPRWAVTISELRGLLAVSTGKKIPLTDMVPSAQYPAIRSHSL